MSKKQSLNGQTAEVVEHLSIGRSGTGGSRGIREPSWMNDDFSNRKLAATPTALAVFILSATLIKMLLGGSWCTQRRMSLVVAAFVAFAKSKAMITTRSTRFPTIHRNQQRQHFLSGFPLTRSIRPFTPERVFARKSKSKCTQCRYIWSNTVMFLC
jgi:hypothetical protein